MRRFIRCCVSLVCICVLTSSAFGQWESRPQLTRIIGRTVRGISIIDDKGMGTVAVCSQSDDGHTDLSIVSSDPGRTVQRVTIAEGTCRLYSAANSFAAIGMKSGRLFTIQNVSKPTVTDSIHEGNWSSLAIAPDGLKMYLGDEDGRVFVVHVAKDRIEQIFETARRRDVTHLQMSRNGKYLLAGSDAGGIQIYDLMNGTLRDIVTSTEKYGSNFVLSGAVGDRGSLAVWARWDRNVMWRMAGVAERSKIDIDKLWPIAIATLGHDELFAFTMKASIDIVSGSKGSVIGRCVEAKQFTSAIDYNPESRILVGASLRGEISWWRIPKSE